MEETARIRVKHIDRLTRNMHMDITMKSGDSKRGYFKRFVARDLNGKNQFRGSISELQQLISGLSADQIGLFFTDSEQDPPKVNGQGPFVKSDSVQIKDIKEIYLLPPAALVPFIQKQQNTIDNLQGRLESAEATISRLESRQQKLEAVLSKMGEGSRKSKHSNA